MDHPEKNIQNPYAPYRKEAFYCLIIDIVVAISITLLLLLAGAGWFLLPILPVFFVCTFLINYLTVLRARREVRGELFETATVEILGVKEAFSAAGYWGSILKEIYPKQLHAGRVQILCRDDSGQRLVLRGIMSEEKQQLLRDAIDRKLLTHSSVTYGKYSRILLTCNDRGEFADTFHQKF